MSHMVNPFDRNFFRFLFGFVAILAVSFSVIYLVGRYVGNAPIEASVGTK